jgi:UDP-2,4-diacetamido-2,4,6-trideoxy-beta-L-altropyranose hydrolase
MVKKILCRADGNSKTGLGHLYRMLAIAAFYKEEYELIILTQKTSVLTIIPEEYTTICIPEDITISSEPNWLSERYDPFEYTIIADGYQFVSSYQKEIKNHGYTLLYVDDLTTEYMYADIVINHSPHCTALDFKAENHTQYALGTNYAMLRPKFNEVATLKRRITTIENAFVCFGGADQYDLSLKAAMALLNNKNIKEIHVVLGGAYVHKRIYDVAKENEKVHLYKNLDEVFLCELMQSCQIAIAPSSTILYELCSVKMPILSGYFVDNQKHINSALAKKGVIFNGGDFRNYTSVDFQYKIDDIIKSVDVESCTLKQQKLFDGKNKRRFLSLLNQLHITCRKAAEQDLIKVYDWSNDILVRENSYNSKPIELVNHSNWFLKKINDSKTLFLIVEVNGAPAGIVRYDITDTHAVVGVVVSKPFRGQGLASHFLLEGAREYFKTFDKPIFAYIKKENIASVKSFENAKYVYLKEETIQGSSSFVYKLDKKDGVR